ncbi:hypothetical protein FZC35_01925 [Candidatus Cytomitobacter indipagum]|uniref:Uncharacterized protein n=1 Tax=Candidatus Cytomitobacter indipagum TaxID=2601575 RepID=A0A5C0UDK5_9PROT|nr:hypothetical protein [Candidatus Cytomitobacter indipagum]QEK38125.1 hypothetical protein FZC35_01925 [Candidatus Cytomitobacter indipagum]
MLKTFTILFASLSIFATQDQEYFSDSTSSISSIILVEPCDSDDSDDSSQENFNQLTEIRINSIILQKAIRTGMVKIINHEIQDRNVLYAQEDDSFDNLRQYLDQLKL